MVEPRRVVGSSTAELDRSPGKESDVVLARDGCTLSLLVKVNSGLDGG